MHGTALLSGSVCCKKHIYRRRTMADKTAVVLGTATPGGRFRADGNP
jgi:hypothetical protein